MEKKELLNFELCSLSSVKDVSLQGVPESLHEICQFLLKQEYDTCLQLCMKKFNRNVNSLAQLRDIMQEYSNNCSDNERHIVLYCYGVSCLQLFVQINWTGPQVQQQHPWKSEMTEEIMSCVHEQLKSDEQKIYHLTSASHYLYLAKECFNLLLETELKTVHWWLLRCHITHQQILNESTDSLLNECDDSLQRALQAEYLDLNENKSFLLQLHLEAGLVMLRFYQYKVANDHFEAAKKLAAISFNFTGALGVRTKFQQTPVPQLQFITHKEESCDLQTRVTQTNSLPVNLSLNDDTVLDKVKLVNPEEIPSVDLVPEQSAIVLAACSAMQQTSPAHRLRQEETGAILEFLLNSSSCWCIQSEALRIRCMNECDSGRRVERSMTQMENLVQSVRKSEDAGHGRMDLFYSVQPPPIWKMEKDLAQLFISLGAVSSALQIYERLEMWEETVLCLLKSGRSGDAMNLINDRLKEKDDSTMWCLLGDIMQEPKHYLRAWEISNHKNSRAMRSLGAYYTSKKEFEKAVECFEKSLSILTLQVGTWFTLGCTLLALEKYEKAATAFRRCVGLEWDNFEAWSNLATSYIKSGKKVPAYKALSEAVKCNFNRWELWENYIAVSIDVGDFSSGIRAYHRLMDLKSKYLDVPILQILVKAVMEDIIDKNGNPGSSLKSNVYELFGRIVSKSTTDFDIWQLYGKLYGDGVSSDTEENTKAIQHLHKALSVGTQKQAWDKDEEFVLNLIQVAHRISIACSHCSENISKQSLASIRLTLKGFSSKLKQREKAILDSTVQETFQNHITEVETYLESVTSQLNLLNAA
ncbi:tetratricopeptide repeat protein 27 isoform X2 [Ciona intestinalis]